MRNSKIILAKNINLDRNYKNVLNYTETQMLALVNTNKVGESTFNSFIRQNGNSIATNFSYSNALSANYIAFQNPDYSNKWFFAWIDEIIYKNDSNIEIRYTIDAWSTWFEKLQLKNCFITREHVSDDTIGLHTIPENIDVGEVIEESMFEEDDYYRSTGYYVAIQSDWTPKDGTNGGSLIDSDNGAQFSGIAVYDSVVYGSQIFLIKITNIGDFANVLLFISRTNLDRHINDIHNIFIVPDIAVTVTDLTLHTAYVGNTSLPFSWYTMAYNSTIESFDTTISKVTSFTGVTIKNNKCFVYPYNYLFVSNNNGSNNIYRYEEFSSQDAVFSNQFCLTIGGSGRLVPKSYKGMTTNDDEALALGKFPTCAWSSDAFTNWLTQNGINIAVQAVTLGTGLALAGATGGASIPAMSTLSTMTQQEQQQAVSQYSSGLNTASQVANLIGSFYQASLIPNIQGGQATGDIIWGADKNCFTFRKMRVKNEYISIIDSYFTRFGYKVNRLGTPNLTSRTYWNYVEIAQGEQVGFGEIPSIYLQVINSAFINGVTIWHNHSNIGNYSLNNTIVT